MKKDIIEIKLFDGFDILRDGQPILANLSNTRKTKLFVAYLLVNRERAIPHRELFELLWSGEEYANPGTALRTLLYRFRSLLEKEGAVQLENAVISKRGTYQWNKALDVRIDALDFEDLANAGLNVDSSSKYRKECLKGAIDLYRGPLLPDFKSEPWMISKAAYYRDLYARVVQNYIAILKDECRYLEIVNICDTALSLIGTSEVIELEGAIAKLNLIDAGKNSGKELDSYYEQVQKLSEKLVEDAAKMQEDLEDDTVLQKAFVCDYDTFKEIYRLQRRMQARTKSTMFLGLMDIRIADENDIPEDIVRFERLMNDVVECCARQLRCGDAICRKGSEQLAILFPADSYEDAIGVLERVKNACKERSGENLIMVYRMRTLKNAKE